MNTKPFILFVYRDENHFKEDSILLCKEWVTELPQIGHTILFTHDDKFCRAKIISIEWFLGTDDAWMQGGSIHIYAEITN